MSGADLGEGIYSEGLCMVLSTETVDDRWEAVSVVLSGAGSRRAQEWGISGDA